MDERGVLGEVGRKIDPSNIVFDAADCAGFKAMLRMGRSDKNKGHRAWGTGCCGTAAGNHPGRRQPGTLQILLIKRSQ